MYRHRAITRIPDLLYESSAFVSVATAFGIHTSACLRPLQGAPRSSAASIQVPSNTPSLAPPLRHPPTSFSLRLYTQGAKADAVLAQFERPPTSLEVPPEPNAEDEMAAVAGANSPLRRLLWLLGFNSSEAVNIRAATRLYDAICTQTDTPGLHDSVQMEPVFYSRWCLLMLHMWMLIHRLSADGDATRALRQELYDLFQEDVEVRVRQQVQVRVATTVTDLEKAFYGTALALDRALQEEEPLWTAIHRNVYGGDDDKEAAAKLLTAYIRRERKCLEMTDSDALVRGRVQFSRVHG